VKSGQLKFLENQSQLQLLKDRDGWRSNYFIGVFLLSCRILFGTEADLSVRQTAGRGSLAGACRGHSRV
jgi:hypothetical protein